MINEFLLAEAFYASAQQPFNRSPDLFHFGGMTNISPNGKIVFSFPFTMFDSEAFREGSGEWIKKQYANLNETMIERGLREF